MSENARIEPRFDLPVRIRSRKHSGDDLQARLDLIDRIADLQGIEVAEERDDAVPCRVDVYLQRPRQVPPRKDTRPTLLCSLSRDGISIFGLDRLARHRILVRRWGGLNETSALVYLPRDADEVEAVWAIVRRAYENQKIEPAKAFDGPVVSTWGWPRVSRTSLQ